MSLSSQDAVLRAAEVQAGGSASERSRWLTGAVPRFVLANLPFVVALAAIDRVPSFVQVLVAGTILFLAPGLAWVDRRSLDGFATLFLTVIRSLAITVACWLPLMLLPGPINRTAFLLAMAGATNAGLVLGSRRGWYGATIPASPIVPALLLVAALYFLQTFAGALYKVPALEDQDMETQGTAYGLIQDFTPDMVTNRGTTYFFAHPLLLHFWIGSSALVLDDLDRLRYYQESAREVRGQSWATLDRKWAQDFERFQRDPVLQATRTPNLFLAVFGLLALGAIVFRLTGSQSAAITAAAVYATLPEIYVRSSYGGYMAITNFLMLSSAYFYLAGAGLFRYGTDAPAPGSARRWGFTAAALAACSNQKAILVPAAAAVHAVLRTWSLDGPRQFLRNFRHRQEVVTAFVIGIGFIAGWAAFTIYGLAIDQRAFIMEHVKGHVLDRISLSDVNLASDTAAGFAYPSIQMLWLQFSEHVGWPVAIAFAVGMISAVPRLTSARGLFLIWAAAGAIGFSLIDWRQTKHLTTIIPAFVTLAILYGATLEGAARRLWMMLLWVGVAWNLYRVFQLMNDFTYIVPTPIW
jgi:hypothetical protein